MFAQMSMLNARDSEQQDKVAAAKAEREAKKQQKFLEVQRTQLQRALLEHHYMREPEQVPERERQVPAPPEEAQPQPHGTRPS